MQRQVADWDPVGARAWGGCRTAGLPRGQGRCPGAGGDLEGDGLLQLQMGERAPRPCSEILGAEAPQGLDLSALLLLLQLQGPSSIRPRQAAECDGARLQL